MFIFCILTSWICDFCSTQHSSSERVFLRIYVLGLEKWEKHTLSILITSNMLIGKNISIFKCRFFSVSYVVSILVFRCVRFKSMFSTDIFLDEGHSQFGARHAHMLLLNCYSNQDTKLRFNINYLLLNLDCTGGIRRWYFWSVLGNKIWQYVLKHNYLSHNG